MTHAFDKHVYTNRISLQYEVSRNNRIERVAPGRYLEGHVKEPYEISRSITLGARP